MDFKLETFLPYRLNQAAEQVSQRFAAQYRARYRMTRPEWRALAALGAYGRLGALPPTRRFLAHIPAGRRMLTRAIDHLGGLPALAALVRL